MTFGQKALAVREIEELLEDRLMGIDCRYNQFKEAILIAEATTEEMEDCDCIDELWEAIDATSDRQDQSSGDGTGDSKRD